MSPGGKPPAGSTITVYRGPARTAVRIAAGSYGYGNPDEYLAYADLGPGDVRDHLRRRDMKVGYATAEGLLAEARREPR